MLPYREHVEKLVSQTIWKSNDWNFKINKILHLQSKFYPIQIIFPSLRAINKYDTYPKYLDTQTLYHTCPIISKNLPFHHENMPI